VSVLFELDGMRELFSFHPNYASRLIRVFADLRHLSVYRLDNHDLFLLKMDSARPKDLSDMYFMIRRNLVNKSECDRLFYEWVEQMYGGDPHLKERYENIWREC